MRLGAVLAINAGTTTLADGAALSGAGTIAVQGGTLNVTAGTATSDTATTVLLQQWYDHQRRYFDGRRSPDMDRRDDVRLGDDQRRRRHVHR